MSRKKISQLESAVDVTANDLIQVIDVEDGDMAPSGTNKKATAQLLANELGKLTNVTATGSTTARSLANRFADVVNVRDFGAVGNGVADDTAAIQAALNYAETKSGTVFVPFGTYKCTSSLLVKSISIIGEGTDVFAKGASVFDFTSANSDINAVVVSSGTSNRLDGVAIENIQIWRSSSSPTAGSGSIGIKLVGVIGFNIKNVLTNGFDIGSYITSTSTGGVCSGGIMEMCRFENNGTAGMKNDACIESVFLRCKFGVANYCIWILSDGINPYSCNGNQWIGGTAIANSSSKAINCLKIDAGFYNNFSDIAFEQASSYGINISLPVQASPQGSTIHASFKNIWMDGCSGVYCKNANINITGSRIWSNPPTGSGNSVITLDTDSSFPLSDARSIIVGNLIAWNSNGAGISINRYSGANISNNAIYDISTTLFPFVTFASSSAKCIVTNNDFAGAAPGWAGVIGNNLFLNRVGAGSDSAIYRATSNLQVSGDYVYSLISGNNVLDQRYGTNANTAASQIVRGGGGAAQFNLGATSSTLGAYDFMPTNTDVAMYRGWAANGANFDPIGGLRITTGTVSDSTNGTSGQVIFTTKPQGSAELFRISIDQSGNLKPLTDNAYTLGASGLRWSSVWSANGTIQTSDERTKKDIEDSTLGLDFIDSLHPVSYKFKVGGNKVIRQVYRDSEGNEVDANADDASPAEIITEEVEGQRTHFGLIAQEVKAALPAGTDFGGWILTDKDDPDSEQGLRYEQFIAPLIKAVQELKARVEELENA